MDVVAINKELGQAIMDDGALVPVTVWLDRDGDECEPDEAVVAVVGPDPDGWWRPVLLSNFERAPIH